MRTTSRMTVSHLLGQAAMALVLLDGGRASRGEAIAPARGDLVKTERKLEAVRGRVTVTAEQLSAAQSLRMARTSVVRACQMAHDAAERARNEARKAEALARNEAAEAEQLAREATTAAQRGRRLMEFARDRFLDRSLVAYDIEQRGKLAFNAVTGSFDLSLDNGPGITLGPGDGDALLAGKFQLPHVDPLRLAPEAAGSYPRLTSNYSEVRASLDAEHGRANVYLLSQRFLDWATPERLSGEIAHASTAAGRSVVGELAETRRQIQREYEDLAVWLWLKGIKDLGPAPSSIVVELIRTGACPRLGLTVKTRPVEYTRRLEPRGRTEVPVDYLARLRPTGLSPHPQAQAFCETRPALAIIWSGPAKSQESLVSQLAGDFRLAPPPIKDLAKLLPSQTDPKVRRLLEECSRHGFLEIDATAMSRRVARAAIGLRKEDVESSTAADRRAIAPRRSDLGEIVASLVSQLALGNQKSSDLDALELDPSSGRLEAGFTLHHRHVWPSLRDARAELKAALGPAGTEIEDLADRLPDAAFDASRKQYHEADARAHEAGKQAYESEQKAHEAADLVATKGQELATLAGELARARADLRAATDREAVARQAAQTACVQMLQLDSQVRLARNNASRPAAPDSSAKPLMYGSLDVPRGHY